MSILSMVRKGRLLFPEDEYAQAWARAASGEVPIKLINIHGVVEDVIHDVSEDGFNIEQGPNVPMTPPYEDLWMEAIPQTARGPKRIAILVHRYFRPFPDQLIVAVARKFPDAHCIVRLRLGYEEFGYVVTDLIEVVLALGPDGRYLSAPCEGGGWGSRSVHLSDGLKRLYSNIDLDADDRPGTEQDGFVELGVHALGRMNCANVQIKPVRSNRSAVVRIDSKQQRNPPIVWHEIVVGALPLRNPNSSPESHSQPVVYRSHWVRGHYADYTKGNGLFGNPALRKVFWMPEHKRGDESVGTVIGSYKLPPRTSQHRAG